MRALRRPTYIGPVIWMAVTIWFAINSWPGVQVSSINETPAGGGWGSEMIVLPFFIWGVIWFGLIWSVRRGALPRKWWASRTTHP